MKPIHASFALASLAATIACAPIALAGESGKHVSITESLKDVTGTEFDRQFLALVQDHQEYGMEMAMLAKQRAQSESLREYASDLAETQQKQIAKIERIQASPSVASTDSTAPSAPGSTHAMENTTGASTAAKHSMAGSHQEKLENEMMEGLESATGAEFDGKFIAKMTKHHQRGLELAQYGSARASEQDVKELAEELAKSQQKALDELNGIKTS